MNFFYQNYEQPFFQGLLKWINDFKSTTQISIDVEEVMMLHVASFLSDSKTKEDSDLPFWKAMISRITSGAQNTPLIFDCDCPEVIFVSEWGSSNLRKLPSRTLRILEFVRSVRSLETSLFCRVLRRLNSVFLLEMADATAFIQFFEDLATTSDFATIRQLSVEFLGNVLFSDLKPRDHEHVTSILLSKVKDSSTLVRQQVIESLTHILRKSIASNECDSSDPGADPLPDKFLSIRHSILLCLLEHFPNHIESEIEKKCFVSSINAGWFNEEVANHHALFAKSVEEMTLILPLVSNSREKISEIAKFAPSAVKLAYIQELMSRLSNTENLSILSRNLFVVSLFSSSECPYMQGIPAFVNCFQYLESAASESNWAQALECFRSLLDILSDILHDMESIPDEIEDILLKSFTSGCLKFSDPKRFSCAEDIYKAIKCFCALKSPRAILSAIHMLSSNIAFLKLYSECPSEQRSMWGKHFDFLLI